MITAYLVGERVSSTSPQAFGMCEKSWFGEKKDSRVEYSTVEVLYLVRERKMTVMKGKNEIGFDVLMRTFRKKDAKVETKFTVFSDLRKKGYIAKTALKFGAEFRVYDRGENPNSEHARWLMHTVNASDKTNWHDFAARNRVAHSTRKKLLVAVVDEEDSVTYFEAGWVRI